MKYCTECGNSNEDDSLFCLECGTRFPKDVKTLEFKNHLKFKKYISLKNSLIIASSLLIGMMVLFLGKSIYLNSNPFEKTAYGMSKLLGDQTQQGQVSLRVNVTDTGEEIQVLEDMTMYVDYKIDKNSIYAKPELKLDNNHVFESVVAMNEQAFYIDFLEYYEDVLYYELEDQSELVEDLKMYLSMFELESFDSKKYSELIAKEIENSFERKGNQVIVELDGGDFLDVIEALYEELADDTDLLEEIHTDIVDILETMLDDGFEYTLYDHSYYDIALTESLLENMIDELGDQDDFVDFMEEGLNRSVRDMGDISKDELNELQIEMTINFDMFQHIKSIETLMEVERERVYIDFNFEKPYKFEKYSLKNAESFEDILYDDELVDLVEEIGENVIETFVENEDNLDYIEDMEVYESYRYYNNGDGEDMLFSLLNELLYNIGY